ncbi:cupin domain-containing protein [Mesorhizobium sp. B3-1-3]|uniref:cupin domain-containing protein n=1 Tax=Mesorhizobium sp. B3-1-3 TaxID=2589896 RepID=UPI001AEDD3BB|nr:cupin domain-containing protein [Mesorhizobium sp. B3-1-3]
MDLSFSDGSAIGAKPFAVVDETFSQTLGAGYIRLNGNPINWTLSYDEVVVVLEGKAKITIDDDTVELLPGDSMWLPRSTSLTYDGEDAILFYAVYPVDWRTSKPNM